MNKREELRIINDFCGTAKVSLSDLGEYLLKIIDAKKKAAEGLSDDVMARSASDVSRLTANLEDISQGVSRGVERIEEVHKNVESLLKENLLVSSGSKLSEEKPMSGRK